MAHHKLDMGKAWTQATGLIGSNRDTVGAIAGLFFFLPALALALFAPELVSPEPAAPPGTDPQVAMEAMMAQITQAYADNWPVFLVMTIVQFAGSLALLALLTDRGRPTVREALMIGIASMIPYLLAQLISSLAIALVIGVPIGLIAAAGSPAAAVLAGIVLVVIGIYMFIKFTLTAPVIAIEGERNPLKALGRSWRLTKGNSFRIAAFLFLLFFTIGIIAALVSGIFGLAVSALGKDIAAIGNGVVSALVNSGIGVIFLVVVAAIHRQLAGHSPEGLAATFE